MQNLKGFNPATALKGYTINPQETSLQPQEGSNPFASLGLNALKNNSTAHEVYNKALNKLDSANPNTPEMQYAETILGDPDGVLEGTCYKEASHCKIESTVKSCEESLQYSMVSCKEMTLSVTVKSLSMSFSQNCGATTI
ncbi:hypothetical protein PGH45_19125 [Legionella pneumophila]|nr:hypothetical protein [Legionella pneumophila]